MGEEPHFLDPAAAGREHILDIADAKNRQLLRDLSDIGRFRGRRLDRRIRHRLHLDLTGGAALLGPGDGRGLLRSKLLRLQHLPVGGIAPGHVRLVPEKAQHAEDYGDPCLGVHDQSKSESVE